VFHRTVFDGRERGEAVGGGDGRDRLWLWSMLPWSIFEWSIWLWSIFEWSIWL